MNIYKIIVSRNAKPWCEILIDNGSRSKAILNDCFSERFPVSEGFQLTYMKSEGENRLLASSPDGLKVISREVIFVPYEQGLVN